MGQYLKNLQKHASSVGLIRNLRTGYISPQFNVIYDNNFHTLVDGEDVNEAVMKKN